MFAKFKCHECKELMAIKTNPAYTYGQCEHYFCSQCSNEYGETSPCPANLCSFKDRTARIEHNLSKAFANAFAKFETPMCATHDQQIEFICFDPNCAQSSNLCCYNCIEFGHKQCEKVLHPLLKIFFSRMKIDLAKYSPLIRNVKAKLEERQLVCNQLEDISVFIDQRIGRLCNLEDQFFCPNGFKSEYELVNKDTDILVHDKVLKQVEPLVTKLLENWEAKSLENISAGLGEIGTLCKVRNVNVMRSFRPHNIITKKKKIPVDDMDEMKPARQAPAYVD